MIKRLRSIVVAIALIMGVTGLLTHLIPLIPTLTHQANAVRSVPDIAGLYQETNQARAAQGLPPLRLDPVLSGTAATKCSDMATRGYFGHNTPDGQEFSTVIRAAYPEALTVSENLAQGFTTSLTTVRGWLASPGHRASIMNTAHHSVGFAVCDTPQYHNVVVQHFSSVL